MKHIFLLLILVTACNKKTEDAVSDASSTEPVSSGADKPAPVASPVPTPAPVPTQPPTVVEQKTLTEEFMELVNNHRRDLGLRSLIHDEGLGDVAREHSENMANKTVAFGHSGFASRCSEARSIMGGGNLCAENVAMGQKSVTAVFNGWMNSPGHRANIEQSRSTHTGFGYKKNSSGTYYWTQIFLELK